MQNRQRCDSQIAWSSAAARITSFTASGFLEPSLLFYKPGTWSRRSRSDAVIGIAAEHRYGELAIQTAQFLAAETLHFRPRLPPCLDPATA
jgi:hypothetical protein